MSTPAILIGLPFSTRGVLLDAARALRAPVLVSAGSLWVGDRFKHPGDAAWLSCGASLDSAGFVAMKQGGYRWTVCEYVAFVVQSSSKQIDGDACWPGIPWRWWSAMDYCVEPEIAADRTEVERRIALTVSTLAETLSHVDQWRDEGVTDLADPMPILQGRVASDYLACAAGLDRVLRDAGRDGLPSLVGVGSVCRRHLHGPDGLLTILRELDRALPPHVRLHLFGVKGAALSHVSELLHRIASVDSMAWDFAARIEARKEGRPSTVEHRADAMRRWYRTQLDRLADACPSPAGGRSLPDQMSLWGTA